MKKLLKVIAVIGFVFQFAILSCSFSPKKVDDSNLLKDFPPLEWSDDYVFGSTLYPPRICVWNSQNGKLIRQYDFFKAGSSDSFFKNGGKWLRLKAENLQPVNKSIWFITYGNQCSLVKLNLETGKIKSVDLKQEFDYIAFIPEANGGEGAILVVPFAQYKQNVYIRLFDLEMNLLQEYVLEPSDLHILTAEGQYKDGFYYFCASCHCDVKSPEPADGTYKIIKLNLSSSDYEIIKLKTNQIFESSFLETNMPTLRKEYYSTSFSVKPGKSDNGNFMVAVDFIGGDVGRFLFETNDLSEAKFSYTGKKLLYSDRVEVFPRMYFQMNENYSMIGNYCGDLYAIFYGESKDDIVFIPDAEPSFCMKDNSVWSAKNPYKYSSASDEWILDGEGMYKIDIENNSVYLYSSDGLCTKLNPTVFQKESHLNSLNLGVDVQ